MAIWVLQTGGLLDLSPDTSEGGGKKNSLPPRFISVYALETNVIFNTMGFF